MTAPENTMTINPFGLLKHQAMTALRFVVILATFASSLLAETCCGGSGGSGSGGSSSGGCSPEQYIRVYPASGSTLCPGDVVDVYLEGCSCSGESITFTAHFRPVPGNGSITPESNESRHWQFKVPEPDGINGVPGPWEVEAYASGSWSCQSTQPTFPNSTFHASFTVGGPTAGPAPTGTITVASGVECQGVVLVEPGLTVSITIAPTDVDKTCKNNDLQDSFTKEHALKWESDGGGEFIPEEGTTVLFLPPAGEPCKIKITSKGNDDATAAGTVDDTASGDSHVELASKTIQYFALDGVTVDLSGSLLWQQGQQVKATAAIRGCMDGLSLLYELVSVAGGEEVVDSANVAALQHTFTLPEGGKYLVRVSICALSRSSSEFIRFEVDVDTTTLEFSWDAVSGQVEGEKWRELDKVNDLIKDGILQAAGWVSGKVSTATAAAAETSTQMNRFAEAKLAADQATIDAKNVRIGQLEAELPGLEARVDPLQREIDRLQPQADRAQRLLDERLAEIADIDRQLADPTLSKKARKALENDRRQLVRVADRYRETLERVLRPLNSTKMTLALIKARIVEIGLEIADARNLIASLTARMAAVRAAYLDFKSAWGAKNAKTILAAGRVFSAALVVYDVYKGIDTLVEFDQAIDALNERYQAIQNFQERYKEQLAALLASNAERVPPPQVKPFNVTTKPGGIRLSFWEFSQWVTKDEDIPASEAAWEFKHLALLAGNPTAWRNDSETYFTTPDGRTGELGFPIFVYGNIGSSRIIIHAEDVPANRVITVNSRGLTEEQALNFLETQTAEAKREQEINQKAIDKVVALASVASGVVFFVLLAIAAAGVITFGTAFLVAAIAGLAIFLFDVLASGLNWFLGEGDHHLADSVEDAYPSEASAQ